MVYYAINHELKASLKTLVMCVRNFIFRLHVWCHACVPCFGKQLIWNVTFLLWYSILEKYKRSIHNQVFCTCIHFLMQQTHLQFLPSTYEQLCYCLFIFLFQSTWALLETVLQVRKRMSHPCNQWQLTSDVSTLDSLLFIDNIAAMLSLCIQCTKPSKNIVKVEIPFKKSHNLIRDPVMG